MKGVSERSAWGRHEGPGSFPLVSKGSHGKGPRAAAPAAGSRGAPHESTELDRSQPYTGALTPHKQIKITRDISPHSVHTARLPSQLYDLGLFSAARFVRQYPVRKVYGIALVVAVTVQRCLCGRKHDLR